MEDMVAETWLVLKARAKQRVDLIAIGYKNCKNKSLHFIMMEGCGSTEPGQPYIAKFQNLDGKLVKKHIACPKVLVQFFGVVNAIDFQNHIQQGTMWLKKRWQTEDCWFQLFTMIVGIILTDCWLSYKHAIKLVEKRSKRCHKHHDISLQEVTKWMVVTLIINPYNKITEPEFIELTLLTEDIHYSILNI